MKKYLPTLRDYFLIILSALIQAFSLRTFFIPANLASGGVSGVAQLINHFTGWQIGLMILIGNVPLFILGWRFLGGYRFALRTAVAIATYSIFIDLLPNTPLFAEGGAGAALIRDLRGDVFLNTLYGAIVSGVGYGLIYRARGTSGGSDILARILNNWRGIPITQSYLFVDSAVILGAGFVFGWKQALFTQTYSTRYGCDSLSQVYLSIAPYKMTYIDHKICQADSIWVIDRYVNAPGILLDTVSVSAGCHEIVRHEVKLLSNSAAKTQAYLCPDSSLNIFGKLISAPGLYVFDQFTNAAGCDSIVTVDVMAVSPSERPAIIVHCEENTYTIIAPPSAEWWYIGPDGNGFDTLQVNKGGPLQIQASLRYFFVTKPIILTFRIFHHFLTYLP